MVSGRGHPNGPEPGSRAGDERPPRRSLWAPRRRGPRRRVRGVVRRINTWSVFRVSVLFYVALYGILLVAGAILWAAATATGLRGNVESFIADLIASGKFEFVGTELFRASFVGGAILVVLGTAFNVLLAVLYNLISEVVGGISLVVEEAPARTGRTGAEAEAPPAVEATSGPPQILVPEAELKQPRRSPGRTPPVVRQTPS
ncbi:MAG TPA: DUF3566 domain-containing protein [Acidimicrobiales bacterium]|nr:DUF3566 domain-containing protein [Acidimicrobiales bacterium]